MLFSYIKINSYVHQSIRLCVYILKGYFLRLKVDEIRVEDRCSGMVSTRSLRILLKIILTKIISI